MKKPSNQNVPITPPEDSLVGTWYDWCDKESFVKWSQIYLSCAPVDLPRAREALTRIYRAAELSPPRALIVCDGPLAAALARLLLEGKRVDSLRPILGDVVWASARASVGRTRPKHLKALIAPPGRDWDEGEGEKRLQRSVWAGMWAQHHQRILNERWQRPIAERYGRLSRTGFLGALHALQRAFEPGKAYTDTLWDCWWKSDTCQDSLNMVVEWKYMWERLGYPEGELLVGSLHEMLFGAHDADWLMTFDCGQQGCSFVETELLAGLLELTQCCGWWAPYKDLVILQHRPLEIDPCKSRRATLQLGPGDIKVQQCELSDREDMAVKYRDGWGWVA